MPRDIVANEKDKKGVRGAVGGLLFSFLLFAPVTSATQTHPDICWQRRQQKEEGLFRAERNIRDMRQRQKCEGGTKNEKMKF